ncbi:MAG: ATP-dependent sacrificial sulfur transferase LarE [Coprococcus sp.]
MVDLMNKYNLLCERLNEYTKSNIAVAFSGGVDSSLLLLLAVNAANKNGNSVYAYTIATTLHPAKEISDAVSMAEQIGAVSRVIHVDELKEAGIENNPVNRCYLCKKCMFSKLKKDVGNLVVLEGTNEDDMHVFRPGIKALKELGVISPLADVHLTKSEIRYLAKDFGIETADKPSAPCMATRFPYNTRLNKSQLEQVAAMEDYIRSIGLYNVRCRVHGNLVRIEVDYDAVDMIMKYRESIVEYIKMKGYRYVTVDMDGFHSGSWDI